MLRIPALPDDADTLDAAFAYAAAGLYLLPVNPSTKSPGSIVGAGWPGQSTIEPDVLVSWFAGTDSAIAIHAGRSGLIVFDVDTPDKLPDVLRDAIQATRPPFQSTRANDPQRGHYVFRIPPGRSLGNRPGGLGVGWGEVRGANGVIVVAPSVHTKPNGQYAWVTTGAIPVLPESIASLLPDVGDQEAAVPDAEIEVFLDLHKKSQRIDALVPIDTHFREQVAKGGSRHVEATHALCWAFREAQLGYYPARIAYKRLEAVFVELLAEARTGSDRQLPRALAVAEFRGCAAWAIGQARAEVLTTSAPVVDGGEDAEPACAAGGAAVERDRLDTLARSHAAESRAADQVAKAVLRGRYRFCPALGWVRWTGARWDDGTTNSGRAVEEVRRWIDETERAYRLEEHEARARWQGFLKPLLLQLTPDDRLSSRGRELTVKESMLKGVRNGSISQEDVDEAKRRENAFCAVAEQADMWMNMLSRAKITSIVALCQNEEGILTDALEFDAHPHLLNVQNGIVDLSTGELLDHDPDCLLTKITEGEYRHGYSHPRWTQALEAVPQDVQQWFQLRMGQSVTGYMPTDDALVLAIGGGENGKSAIMTGALQAVGSYGGLISHRVLTGNSEQHPTEMMDLLGLRFALMEETAEEGHLDPHQLKITVGTPLIKARRMRADTVQFKATHTLWINTNHRPQVESTDHGTWRRLKVLPFPYRFRKPWEDLVDENDRPGDTGMRDEVLSGDLDIYSAIVSWMVEGAVAWYANGRHMPVDPERVAAAIRVWRTTTDVGLQFAQERLVADPESFITGEVMRRAFNEFLTEQGKREWSAKTLNARMPESMFAAGMTAAATPDKPSKIRASEKGSIPAQSTEWCSTQYPPPPPVGSVARIWRGVRFQTERERREGLNTTLRAV